MGRGHRYVFCEAYGAIRSKPTKAIGTIVDDLRPNESEANDYRSGPVSLQVWG
jgi:hypothetical protein